MKKIAPILSSLLVISLTLYLSAFTPLAADNGYRPPESITSIETVGDTAIFNVLICKKTSSISGPFSPGADLKNGLKLAHMDDFWAGRCEMFGPKTTEKHANIVGLTKLRK